MDDIQRRIKKILERISKFEGITIEIASLNNTEKINSRRELWNSNKRSNMFVLGVPEVEERKNVELKKYLKY